MKYDCFHSFLSDNSRIMSGRTAGQDDALSTRDTQQSQIILYFNLKCCHLITLIFVKICIQNLYLIRFIHTESN